MVQNKKVKNNTNNTKTKNTKPKKEKKPAMKNGNGLAKVKALAQESKK